MCINIVGGSLKEIEGYLKNEESLMIQIDSSSLKQSLHLAV